MSWEILRLMKGNTRFWSLRLLCLSFCILLATSAKSQSVCDNISNPGNLVLSSGNSCAPVNFQWFVQWDVAGGDALDVRFVVDWDDGNPEEVIPVTCVGNDCEATVTHLYPTGEDQCLYSPRVRVQVDGVLCDNEQEQTNFKVWDVDNEAGAELIITPNVYRVCVGNSSLVTMEDNSNWNCTPPTISSNLNNADRWTQWVYGTDGIAANRIPGITVGPNSFPGTTNYEENVKYWEPGADFLLTDPQPNGPESRSDNIFVPVTTGADIGKVFEVTLRNWNTCNPYDANLADGDPLNPATPGGDRPFIFTTAQIIIVDTAQAEFETRLNNASGPIQTRFCLNESVYFENITPDIDDDGDGNNDADFSYSWEFRDVTTGTVLNTSTQENPNYTFTTPGQKVITLTVTDGNSVGGCGGRFVKTIDVVETANAAIEVSDLSGNSLPTTLCYDPLSPVSYNVRFKDISSNFDPATSEWIWNFYDETGALADNDSGDTAPDSLEVTITNPGTYMAELIASSVGVPCETRDTAYVHIYAPPTADFTFTAGCQSDSVVLESTAFISQVVNGDNIADYGWDLDNDGTYETTEEGPFKHLFPAAGSYTVRHRVVTQKGQCSDVFTDVITVQPSLFASFTPDITQGCTPLTIAFAVDTLLVDQPTAPTDYIWHVKNLDDNSEQLFSYPLADTTELTFLNTLASFADQQYEVWLEVKASNGCDAVSQRDTITVFAGPPSEYIITNFSGSSTNCSPHTFELEVAAATQALSPDEYVWTVFDEADSSIVSTDTISAIDPTYSYTVVNDEALIKQYRIKLQPLANDKCFAPYEEVVQVFPAPSSSFTAAPIDGTCDLVTYELEADQKGLFYQWTVNPAPLNNPSYTAEKLQVVFEKKNLSYPVTVTLKTINGGNACESAVTSETIAIDPREDISTSFTVDPTLLEVPNTTVTITNTTNPGDWTYEWDFGDSTVSNEANPGTHTYATPGEYTIKLRATGTYCFEEDSAKVIIKQTLPQLSFDYTAIEGCLPLEVTFTNTTLYADSTTILWDFGDGTISTEWNPVHTYDVSGVYTVSLQASNELGVVVTEEKTLVVDLTQGPQANFRPRLAQRYIRNEDIYFSNLSQRANSYFWDFGDGTTSTDEEPTHQYAEEGEYDIMLIAYSTLGCTDTLVKEIIIEPLIPEVDFTYEPPKGCRPLTVQFRNLSRYAEADSYRWSFGEGEGVSTEENPVYTYYEPGFYTITLEASNSFGVTVAERKEFSVEVYETPRAYFNLRPDRAFLGEPIYFVNLSYEAENYYWDFGDGNTSTDPNPEHTYEQAGSYDITLIAESNKGCRDTLVVESAVLIENGGKVQVPNAFTPSQFGPSNSEVVGPNGKNDIFLPVFEGVTDFHMMVYNRWGEMLFESFDKNYGWNGYYKGRLCPKDAYVYKLELKFSDGNFKTVVGDVTLVR